MSTCGRNDGMDSVGPVLLAVPCGNFKSSVLPASLTRAARGRSKSSSSLLLRCGPPSAGPLSSGGGGPGGGCRPVFTPGFGFACPFPSPLLPSFPPPGGGGVPPSRGGPSAFADCTVVGTGVGGGTVGGWSVELEAWLTISSVTARVAVSSLAPPRNGKAQALGPRFPRTSIRQQSFGRLNPLVFQTD